jgi:hypothetical protein
MSRINQQSRNWNDDMDQSSQPIKKGGFYEPGHPSTTAPAGPSYIYDPESQHKFQHTASSGDGGASMLMGGFEANTRLGFIRKVYSILAIQLTFTVVVSCFFMFVEVSNQNLVTRIQCQSEIPYL